LISAQGTILKTYSKVRPDAHASEVLADLAQLTDNPE
jgi:peroxiredoxin